MKAFVLALIFCVHVASISAQTPPRAILFSNDLSDLPADSEVYMETSLSIADFQFTPLRICTNGMWLFYNRSSFGGGISHVGVSEFSTCSVGNTVLSVLSFGDPTDMYRNSVTFLNADGVMDGPNYDSNTDYNGSIETMVFTGTRTNGIAFYTLPNFEGLKFCFQIDEFEIGRYLDNFPDETGVPADFFKSYAFEPVSQCTEGKAL